MKHVWISFIFKCSRALVYTLTHFCFPFPFCTTLYSIGDSVAPALKLTNRILYGIHSFNCYQTGLINI